MSKVKKLLAGAMVVSVMGLTTGTAVAEKSGPGSKQCRPGKQNPHCPSSKKG